MAADSPTYNCTSAGTPTANTTSAYCVVPGGHPRMSLCCQQVGSTQPVQFIPDCYTWCALPSSEGKPSDFRNCLSASGGDPVPAGTLCTANDNDEDDDEDGGATATTSTGSGTSTSAQPTPETTGGIVGIPLDGSAAAPNRKVSGVLWGLCIAGLVVAGTSS